MSAQADDEAQIRKVEEGLRDLSLMYWQRCLRTDSNTDRNRAQEIGDLADDLLAITGLEK
jgi:hypothetical protein